MTSSYAVKFGSNSTYGTGIQIESVLVHPSFSSELLDSDIALIRVGNSHGFEATPHYLLT